MKKIIKYFLLFILIAVLLLLLTLFLMNEKKPQGEPGAKAEAIAQKMLTAINKTAWDSTYHIQWSFPGGHDYIWSRKNNLVEVKWDNKRVLIHTKTVTGKVYVDDILLDESASQELIQQAWGYFCNDSFWLLAPTKIYDPGVERSYIKLEDGREALMVTYASGGVTPGDSYLWILDEKGLPTSYKMWVSIIPIGGLEFSWENWTELSTGAMVAQSHKKLFLDIAITNLKVGNNNAELGAAYMD